MKHEFSNELYRFLNPAQGNDQGAITLSITQKHFPYFLRKYFFSDEKDVEIRGIKLIVKLKDELSDKIDESNVGKLLLIKASDTEGFVIDHNLGDLPSAPLDFITSRDQETGWKTTMSIQGILLAENSGLPPDMEGAEVMIGDKSYHRLNSRAIEDIALLLHYGITS
jgi:hypothetical protein